MTPSIPGRLPRLAAVALLLATGPAFALSAEDLDMRFRQMLLDESIITSKEGVERIYGQFEPSGVTLLQAGEPVEREFGRGRFRSPKVIYSPQTGKYQMWCRGRIAREDGPGFLETVFYAESEDALQWSKPHLFNFEYRGDGGANNLVHLGNFHSVIRLPREEHPLMGFEAHAFRVHFMKDGRSIEKTVPLKRQGRTPNEEQIRAERGKFNSDNFNIAYDPVEERFLGMFKTQSRLPDSADPEIWRRAVAPAVSPDGISWTFLGEVLQVDERDEEYLRRYPHMADESVPVRALRKSNSRFPDRSPGDWPPRAELHDFVHFRYEGLYLGLRHHVFAYPIAEGNRADLRPGTHGQHSSEYFLAWSRDFENWTRPETPQPLLPTPEIDAPRFGFYRLAWPCILRMGDDLRLFYDIPDGIGNEWYPRRPQSITSARMRIDGWAGYRAGREQGHVETAFLVADGTLHVNVEAAEGGSLQVEVLDEEGQVIPGFDRSACQPITGDAVAANVHWNDRQWSDLAGKRLRLRFHLNEATLYSFWTREDAEIVGIQSTPEPAGQRGDHR